MAWYNSHECHKTYLEHRVLLPSPFLHVHTFQDHQGEFISTLCSLVWKWVFWCQLPLGKTKVTDHNQQFPSIKLRKQWLGCQVLVLPSTYCVILAKFFNLLDLSFLKNRVGKVKLNSGVIVGLNEMENGKYSAHSTCPLNVGCLSLPIMKWSRTPWFSPLSSTCLLSAGKLQRTNWIEKWKNAEAKENRQDQIVIV